VGYPVCLSEVEFEARHAKMLRLHNQPGTADAHLVIELERWRDNSPRLWMLG
jgi:hypothetical protein